MMMKKMFISKVQVKKNKISSWVLIIRQTSYLSTLTQDVMHFSDSQLTSCFFCSVAAMHILFQTSLQQRMQHTSRLKRLAGDGKEFGRCPTSKAARALAFCL